MHRILLAGDASIVDEFASALRTGGCDVLIPRSLAGPSGRVDAALELRLPDSPEKASAMAALDRLPGEVPLFTTTLAVTLLEQSSRVKRRERLAGIGAYRGVLSGGLIEFALPSAFSPSVREAAESLARALGKEAAFVQDLPGMVLPRIRCMLTNEACFALAERIASAPDIDLAMKLGTNYPSGPLAWGEQFGFANVLAVMEALHRWYAEERYRPAPLLRRAALLGSIRAAMAGHDENADERAMRRGAPGKAERATANKKGKRRG